MTPSNSFFVHVNSSRIYVDMFPTNSKWWSYFSQRRITFGENRDLQQYVKVKLPIVMSLKHLLETKFKSGATGFV